MSRFNVVRPTGAVGPPVAVAVLPPPLSAKQKSLSPRAPIAFQTVSSQRRDVSLYLACVLLFVVVARVTELVASETGSGLKIVPILTVIVGVACLISGRLPATLRLGGTLSILAFTGWWLICVPFSVWPGGSVALLRESWAFSVAAFLIIATAAVSTKCLQYYAGAMAWAALFVNFVLLRFGSETNFRSSVDFSSSLSNPNVAAFHLLLVLPFLIYWTRTSGLLSWRGLLGMANAILVAVLIILRTGSRSGVLILAVLFVLLLTKTQFYTRVIVFLVLFVGIAALAPFVPSYLAYRYGTMLKATQNQANEAAASVNQRRELLNQSIVLTLQRPVFGVGPGQFRVAAAAKLEEEGERSVWLETHNMYTQISSEAGVPGLIIYLAMIYFSLAPVWKDLRLARGGGNLPRYEYGRALLISAVGLFLNSLFISVAYQFYWPVICSLGVAYQRVTALEPSGPASGNAAAVPAG